MSDVKLFSSGEAAGCLGVSRDDLDNAVRAGLEAPRKVGRRRVWMEDDIARARRWFTAKGRKLTPPLDEANNGN